MAHPVFVHIATNEHGVFECMILHGLRHILARSRIPIPPIIPQRVTRTQLVITSAKNSLLRNDIPSARIRFGLGKRLVQPLRLFCTQQGSLGIEPFFALRRVNPA